MRTHANRVRGPFSGPKPKWQQLLAEKDERLRDLHHRVRNNLQMLLSLFSLEVRKIKNSEAAQLLREAQTRVQALVRVHERLQRAEDVAADRIDASKELSAICAEIAHSLGAGTGSVAITIDAKPIEIDADKLVPLSLIVSELLTNSVKHAAPSSVDPTRIRVVIDRDHLGGRGRISIADNGPGFPIGFDLTRSNSLGMRLVDSFVRQLGGTLRIGAGGDEDNTGCLTLSFPLAKQIDKDPAAVTC